MKKEHPSQFGLFNPIPFGLVLCLGLSPAAPALAQEPQENSGIEFGQSYHNDVSPALRDLAALRPPRPPKDGEEENSREANWNPELPLPLHVDVPDPIVDHGLLGLLLPEAMPSTILNFDGIPFPGVTCGCTPPDSNGAVGLNQYVQMVNEGYQVFNKTSGSSILGPFAIETIWTGFGGVCQTDGMGDPIVLYDHLANRWLISESAGTAIPTDECIAISTTSDAAGTYNRYGFHLGSNFFAYPRFGIWPDGYYLAMDVFSGTTFLGPQAFAFDRAKMIAGLPATFVTPGVTGQGSAPPFLPSDLDGTILPAAGTANPFVSFPGSGTYKVRLFHADFVTPANTTFSLIGSPAAAGFTQLCPSTQACVPQLGTTNKLDAIGDRLMFRLAYRKFADGHEAVVSNYSVNTGTVAGVRWFELRAVTTAPTVFQESTYQPDATWRWMGSAAMDQAGDLAIGYSASSASIHPQIRYAGRLVNDPINTLGQGEATLYNGSGSQIDSDRWGAYSAMSVDPVDDCTFWYTQEYISITDNSWRTRIGNFKFPNCPGPTPTPTLTPTPTPTSTPGGTPSPTPTPPCPNATAVFSQNFDGVTPPALPSGWVATNAVDPDMIFWVTSNSGVPLPVTDSAPNAAYINDPADVSDKRLKSRSIAVVSSVAQLTFRNNYNLEASGGIFYDGGVLEISIGGGAFTDIITAGGSFAAGGYSATISTFFGSPIGGRAAWSGNSGGFITTVVNLPAAAAAQNIKLRWRMASDSAIGSEGWRIDGVSILDCLPTPTPTPTPSATPALVSISGTVIYCSNPVPGPVPNVTLTLTGTSGGSTLSDGSGAYTFSSLPSGGSYTVTPTKAVLAPGSTGITGVDAIAVQRHFLNLGTPLSGCRLTAADVTGTNGVDGVDAIAIQRFFLGFTSGIANTGKYQFTPANRTYSAVVSNQTAQNYDALVLGDVAAAFAERVGRPLPSETGDGTSTAEVK